MRTGEGKGASTLWQRGGGTGGGVVLRKRAGPDVGPRLLYGRTGGGGPGWDSWASRAAGTRRASARGAGSGALRSAAAGARGGSRLPRSCGARAARGRERRGKQQAGREGAGGKARAGAAGGRPPWPEQAPRAGGPRSRALGVPEVREEPRAPDLAGGQLRHPPPLPFCASRGVGTGSSNPWRPAAGLFPRAGRTARRRRPSGWARRAPSPRPY